jgi:hypothetical protein
MPFPFAPAKNVPQGLKATKMTRFMPGINPRHTLKTSFSAACEAQTIHIELCAGLSPYLPSRSRLALVWYLASRLYNPLMV